ncbi:MAG: winged helix-turn-helix domain-containing protein, partial [Myxococcota bacterium]
MALRIRAVLRRTQPRPGRSEFVFGDVRVDRSTRALHVGGRRIALTQVETRLLVSLTRAAGSVCDRQRLLREAWPESELDVRCVDTHVRRVREKLGDDADRIETVRGVGYRLVGLPKQAQAELPPS